MKTTETKTIPVDAFSALKFKYPLRRYQEMIIAQVESTKDKDSKFHIVAPPGSGKTIVGLELIRKFSQPAVVFTPTSTIQLQWKQKAGMFIPDGLKMTEDELVSLDPKNLKPINVFTYQLLSTSAEDVEFARDAAASEWTYDLVLQGVVPDESEAKKRIALLRKNNPKAHDAELTKYYKKVKDRMFADPEFDGTQFLHPNARKLIDSLVEQGVKIIVMDEVHHLLDYWAFVLKELIRRIDKPILIGLTATPPLSAGEEEMQTYLSIMGSIDFEIPTPAVVKEGNLAPYQDLVYFCSPTAKEKEYISTIQNRFKDLVSSIGSRQGFKEWIKRRIIERPAGEGKKQEWSTFFRTHPYLAVAGVKFITQIMDEDVSSDIEFMEEMEQDMTLDDWVSLLTDYSLNCLKVGEKPENHTEFLGIAEVLRSFGFVLTEKGIRQYRSPSDAILALSDAKNTATLDILRNEIGSMGNDIRAVVICDFEKASATVTKQLEGVLDEDAGGAVRTFRGIVYDKTTTGLEPVLVTGTTALIDIDELPHIIEHMEAWKNSHGFSFTFKTMPTPYDRIVELVGQGKDWKTNTYVRMVTDLFEEGVIKCIVGTRGLLAEGWDTLALNTLIDLTTATTSMMVNQIRGRSLRLDPKRPRKLSNNWDVVCVDPSFEKGNQDFNRFLKKHGQFYGLSANGTVVKGYLHVDSLMGLENQSFGFRKISYAGVNMRMLAKSKRRDHVYRQWKIGDKYSNFEYTATKIDARDFKFKTVYTLRESLKGIFRTITATITMFALWYFFYFGQFAEAGVQSRSPGITGIAAIIFLGGVFGLAGRSIAKYIQKGFVELPLDSFVLDIGRALLKSLRETGLVAASQSIDNLRVVEDGLGNYDLHLDYATTGDARLFSDCLRELLSPVHTQRYLVSRSEDTIPLGFYSGIWWFFRKVFRLIGQEKTAYHGVPSVLAVKKERALVFAKYWREYVGGGTLIYTRSTEGAELLLKLRAYNRHRIKRLSYDIWK